MLSLKPTTVQVISDPRGLIRKSLVVGAWCGGPCWLCVIVVLLVVAVALAAHGTVRACSPPQSDVVSPSSGVCIVMLWCNVSPTRTSPNTSPTLQILQRNQCLVVVVLAAQSIYIKTLLC